MIFQKCDFTVNHRLHISEDNSQQIIIVLIFVFYYQEHQANIIIIFILIQQGINNIDTRTRSDNYNAPRMPLSPPSCLLFNDDYATSAVVICIVCMYIINERLSIMEYLTVNHIYYVPLS